MDSIHLHKFSGGMRRLHKAGPDAVEWFRPGAIPNPESDSKDESESESGFDSGFGIMCSGIGFGVGIV